MNERIFLQIYQNLEKELLNLTDHIHFSDENLKVYSITLSSFILRCNVEIESLYKEIFRRTKEGSAIAEHNTLVREGFNYVSNICNFKTKQIAIVSDRFYFSEEKSNFLPLAYKNEQNENLTKIYNAIKHDRANNLHKATLEVAINLLGLLYMLNIFFGFSISPQLYTKTSRYDGEISFKSSVFSLKTVSMDYILYSVLFSDEKDVSEFESLITSSLIISWFNYDKLDKCERVYETFSHLKNHDLNDFQDITKLNSKDSIVVFLAGNCLSIEAINFITISTTIEPLVNKGFSIEHFRSELIKRKYLKVD